MLPIKNDRSGSVPDIARSLAESTWTEQFASALQPTDCESDSVVFFSPQELTYNGRATLREFFAHFRAWRKDVVAERAGFTVQFEADEFRNCDWSSSNVKVLAASEYRAEILHTKLHVAVLGCTPDPREKRSIEITRWLEPRKMVVVVGPPPQPVP